MLKGVWLRDVSNFEFQTFEEYGTLYQINLEMTFEEYNKQFADGTAGPNSHIV